ncbi:hypothetical protein SESBI_34138 [Sesbania bispinosa]|nr:hypothetical protein SESBI_34138 [Sesbania bispinosa]
MVDSAAGAVSTANTTVLPLESPTLRRRNSITTTTVVAPNNLSQATATTPMRTTSLELASLKSPFSSYTSLRDVLPYPNAAINSPTASSAANSGYEISIRNRLVKQAAWAYLQPMSASPGGSSAPNFLRRLWHRLSDDNPLAACFSFLYHGFARIFHQILHAFRGQVRS